MAYRDSLLSLNTRVIKTVVLVVVLGAFGSGCSSETAPENEPESHTLIVAGAININTASAEELRSLPHIGKTIAQRIIEHRETYGPFRRPEDLMQVRGISDARFRNIRHLIRIE